MGRKIRIELDLEEEDFKSICIKTAQVGLTVSDLVGNFINDLTCGKNNNGSDERMYAEMWFDRCGFRMMADKTFLRFLTDLDYLNEVLELWNESEELQEEIQCSQDGLLDENNNIWELLVNSQGVRWYMTKKEWEDEEKEDIESNKEELQYVKEELQDIWKNFLKWTDDCGSDLETEMKTILKWKTDCENMLQ